MQYQFSGNDSRLGKFADLMNDSVLKPNEKELVDEITPVQMTTQEISFRTSPKVVATGSTSLSIKSCKPLMPADIVLRDLEGIKDEQTLYLQSYEMNKSHLHIPGSKFIHWIEDPCRLIITSIFETGSFIHVYNYPEMKICFSVYFEKEIIALDYFKYVKFTNVSTILAIIFKDALQVTLYGLPLHCRSKVIEIDSFMDLNIYPQEYPTCVDCKLNHVAIGYANGDVAVFEINEIPISQPMPFYHKYTHTSLVSQVVLPIYMGNIVPIHFVISSGLNGKIVYSEFSVKQSHGGVAISTSAAVTNFTYLLFTDGVLFCDFDDNIKYSTFFSRTEMRRLATIRGGASTFASSTMHPFLAMGGLGGALTIYNTNHTRVKHGKSYIYCASIIKKQEDGTNEFYLMDTKKLPKEPPQSLRTDGSFTHVKGTTKIDGVCWCPLKKKSNIVAQLGNEIISLIEL